MSRKKNELAKVEKKELLIRDTRELGKALHSEALERERKAREDKVIAEVQRLETCRLDYARKQEFAAKAVIWYAGKLEAIRKGEFHLDLTTGLMQFFDPDYERANY